MHGHSRAFVTRFRLQVLWSLQFDKSFWRGFVSLQFALVDKSVMAAGRHTKNLAGVVAPMKLWNMHGHSQATRTPISFTGNNEQRR